MSTEMTRQSKLDRKLLPLALQAQQTETTEAEVYATLSHLMQDQENGRVLAQIAREEQEHAAFWEEHTGIRLKPNRRKVWWYVFLARLLGFTFILKLMETREDAGAANYDRLSQVLPEASKLREAEEEHERKLLAMLDEDRLAYMTSDYACPH
ncbi:MAG: hypothetical protein ACPLRM_02810 [Anaerolineae bacterium]